MSSRSLVSSPPGSPHAEEFDEADDLFDPDHQEVLRRLVDHTTPESTLRRGNSLRHLGHRASIHSATWGRKKVQIATSERITKRHSSRKTMAADRSSKKKGKMAKMLGAEIASVEDDHTQHLRAAILRDKFRVPLDADEHEINPDQYQMARVYQMHKDMPSLDHVKTGQIHSPVAEVTKILRKIPDTNLTLVLDVQHCIYAIPNQRTEVAFSLYSLQHQKQISEEYIIKIKKTGEPMVGKTFEKCTCKFQRLRKEALASDLLLVIKVYRMAPSPLLKYTGEEKKAKKVKGDYESYLAKFPHFRRPYGCAVLNITQRDILSAFTEREAFEVDPHLKIYIPKNMDNENLFERLHEVLVDPERRDDLCVKAPKSIGIGVALQLVWHESDPGTKLPSGWDQFQPIPPINFLPLDGSAFNVLFVELLNGVFEKGGKKSERNVQVRMSLRDRTMNPIEKAVRRGVGPMAPWDTHGKSTVYYHNNQPNYRERFWVKIPSDPEAMEGCHLFFEFSHCSTKDKEDPVPFAWTFWPILDHETRAIIPDAGCIVEEEPEPLEVVCFKYGKKQSTGPYTSHAYFTGAGEDEVGWPEGSKLKTNQSFVIAHSLISNQTTQNSSLWRLFSWRSVKEGELGQVLQAVLEEEPEDLASCLQRLLATCIDILSAPEQQRYHMDAYHVFVRTLSIVETTHTHLHFILDAYIESFDNQNAYILLIKFLKKQLKWAVSKKRLGSREDDSGTTAFEILSQALSGIGYYMKLVMKSYAVFLSELLATPDQIQLAPTIQTEFFSSMDSLYKHMRTILSVGKGLTAFLLPHYLNIFTPFEDFSKIEGPYPTTEIATRVCDFINAIDRAKTATNMAKLSTVRNLMRSSLFQEDKAVLVYLPTLLSQCEFHLKQTLAEQVMAVRIILELLPLFHPHEGRTEQPRFTHLVGTLVNLLPDIFQVYINLRDTYPEELHNCYKQLIAVGYDGKESTEPVFDPTLPDPSKTLIQDVVATIFPFIEVLTMVDEDDTGGHTADTRTTRTNRRFYMLLDNVKEGKKVVKLPVLEQYSALKQTDARGQCLWAMFEAVSSLVLQSVFDPNWILLRLQEVRLAFQILRWSAPILRQYYISKGAFPTPGGPSFDYQLWSKYFELGSTILRCHTLNITDTSAHEMTPHKRDLILEQQGDIRRLLAVESLHQWNLLKDKHTRFAANLVEPAVALAHSPVEEVATLYSQIFVDMLTREFEQRGTFNDVEYHTIDKVDYLVQHASSAEDVRHYVQFFDELSSQLSPKLADRGQQFIEDVKKLFEYLMEVKLLDPTPDNEDMRTSALLRLMKYLNETGKRDLYNRYQIKLYELHEILSNNVERGLTLLHLANSMQWSDKRLPPFPLFDSPKEADRHLECLEMAKTAFDSAGYWEQSIKVCKTLADVYEHRMFDIQALSSVLKQQAGYYDKIMSGERLYPAHYRVAFFGSKFSSELRGQQFIYRSGYRGEIESVMEFSNRIKRMFEKKYGTVQLRNSSDLPPEDVQANENEVPYIQITTLTESSQEDVEGKVSKWAASDAPDLYTKYYLKNEIKIFYYTRVLKERRRKKTEVNEYRNLWVEKSFLQGETELPCLQRRVKVVKVLNVEICPLENAVNVIEEKNAHVESLIRHAEQAEPDKQDLGPLSMQLNGVIDAAVMGGVKKYEEAFFRGDYMEEYPDHKKFVKPFKEALAHQQEIMSKGLKIFETRCDESMQPLAMHLKKMFRKMKKSLSESILSDI